MGQDALGVLYGQDCPIVYGEDISGLVHEVDVWLLPVIEPKRIHDYRDRLLDPIDYFLEKDESDIRLGGEDLRCVRCKLNHVLTLTYL